MYDYVLQYGFDKDTENFVQSIKNYLKENKIKDEERNWLPHITIDLYNCKDQETFISKLDNIINNIKGFSIRFKNLNDFDAKTLYIEPFDTKEFITLKQLFNQRLDEYRLENTRNRIYKPHITLCTNDNINQNTYDLTHNVFHSFVGKIKYIRVYNQNMELIKEYELRYEKKI